MKATFILLTEVIAFSRCASSEMVLCLERRLSALKALLQNLLRAEDVIKVYEARLTEKETSSLDLHEVDDYRSTLKVCSKIIRIMNEEVTPDQLLIKCTVCLSMT